MWRGVEYGPVHAISACTGRVRRQFEICGYGRQYSKSGCAPLCRRSRHLQELIGKERRARLLKTGADAVQSFSISVTSFLGHRCLVTSVGRPGSTARSRPILSSDRPLRHENLGPLALSCGLNGCHKGCLRMEKDCILNATRSIALRAASRPEPPTSWDFERPITTTAAVAAAAAAAAPASAAATADATAASVAFYLDATAASRAAPVPPAPRPQGGVRATFGGWRARQTAPRSPPLARRAPRPLRLAAGDAGGGATAAAGWGQRGATRRARCGAHRHPQRRRARPPRDRKSVV